MKEFFKKEKTIAIFVVLAIFLGTIIGAFLAATSGLDEVTKNFLGEIFAGFEGGDKYLVFLNSFYDNIRVFLIVFLLSFFKFGSIGIVATGLIKGFVSGFTTAVFVKYYSLKGLVVPLASFFSNAIFIPAFVLFLICSAKFTFLKKTKNNVFRFISLSVISFAIFCVSSFLDGYLGTTFMNLLKGFVVKM